jgi:hypothetical protein
MNDLTFDQLDQAVRRHVYQQFREEGGAPTVAETAGALGQPLDEVKGAFERMAQGRVLVLQPESGEILLANPFSAVPTPFLVEAEGRSWWGSCAWDALGVLAALHTDGRVVTSCGDCGRAMTLSVRGGALAEGEGIIHFGVPARQWWDNIVFT